MAETPDPIDVAVGERIAAKRAAAGLTQAALAARIGCSFQQLQKYETAGNRVSASRLQRIAEALRTPIWYFFPDADASPPEGPTPLARQAVERWGHQAQWDMVQEEAIELALAVHRQKRGRGTVEEIAEEVADMEIMCAQARVMLPQGLVEKFKVRKEARLQKKLEG